jgi:hypothetical protein
VSSAFGEQLLRLNLDLADHKIDPERVVWLACDLLVAGLDSPALRELAGESPARLEQSEANALVRQVLVELDIVPMTEEEADWFLGREAALQILRGAPRAEWNNKTWRITMRVNDENDGVYAALNTYEYDPEPFRGYVREYLRIAEKQLTEW